MKYYSEETVKKIIADTVNATLHISTPTEDYPYIELPDKHGDLIDMDALLKSLNLHPTAGGLDEDDLASIGEALFTAPVVLERTT